MKFFLNGIRELCNDEKGDIIGQNAVGRGGETEIKSLGNYFFCFEKSLPYDAVRTCCLGELELLGVVSCHIGVVCNFNIGEIVVLKIVLIDFLAHNV